MVELVIDGCCGFNVNVFYWGIRVLLRVMVREEGLLLDMYLRICRFFRIFFFVMVIGIVVFGGGL